MDLSRQIAELDRSRARIADAADDEGLAGLFRDAGHGVIGSYGQAAGLTDRIAEREPDIVVLDIRLPPTFTECRVRD